jgi:hypothetical protein
VACNGKGRRPKPTPSEYDPLAPNHASALEFSTMRERDWTIRSSGQNEHRNDHCSTGIEQRRKPPLVGFVGV